MSKAFDKKAFIKAATEVEEIMTTPEASKELRERIIANLSNPDYVGISTRTDQIMAILTSDKQKLLKELMEHKQTVKIIVNKRYVEDENFEVIPLQVIQNKLEGLS